MSGYNTAKCSCANHPRQSILVCSNGYHIYFTDT